MNIAYEFLKNYVPIKSALKVRSNGDMLIAVNFNAELYYLNGMAQDIWSFIDNEISINGLKDKILSEYDAEPEVIENDLAEFIRDLQWKKLIRLKGGIR